MELTMIEKIYKNYPQLIGFLEKLIGLFFSLLNFFITTVGIVVLFVLVIVFEFSRVHDGLMLIKSSELLASFGSIVLILMNIVSEVMVVNTEYNETKEPEQIFTLAKLVGRFLYFLGLAQIWNIITNSIRSLVGKGLITYKLKYKRASQKFITLINYVTFTIIFVSLLGSMSELLSASQYAGLNTVEFIVAVLTGEAKDVLILFGGVGLTFTVVFGAQALAGFVTLEALTVNAEIHRKSTEINKRINQKEIYVWSLAQEKFTELKAIALSDEWEIEVKNNQYNLYNKRLKRQTGFMKSIAYIRRRAVKIAEEKV